MPDTDISYEQDILMGVGSTYSVRPVVKLAEDKSTTNLHEQNINK